MDIAQKRNNAGVVKLEALLLSLGPGAEVVPELLVAADRDPEDVMRDAVAVEKVHSGALLNDNQVRDKHQALLVDDDVLCGCWKGLACNGFDIDNGLAAYAGNLALNGAGKSCRAECGHGGQCCQSNALHMFSWLQK